MVMVRSVLGIDCCGMRVGWGDIGRGGGFLGCGGEGEGGEAN